MKKVKEEDLQLYRPEAFDARFIEYTRTHETLQEAWEAVERDFRKVFGQNRYASYESYRISRRRRIV